MKPHDEYPGSRKPADLFAGIRSSSPQVSPVHPREHTHVPPVQRPLSSQPSSSRHPSAIETHTPSTMTPLGYTMAGREITRSQLTRCCRRTVADLPLTTCMYHSCITPRTVAALTIASRHSPHFAMPRSSWLLPAELTLHKGLVTPQPCSAPLALAVLVMAVTGSAVDKPLLWLPLGDSITWGCGTDSPPHGPDSCVDDAGGYRIPLAWALSQAGYNVTTMGTLRTGPSYVPRQWLHHEGHDGWRTRETGSPA